MANDLFEQLTFAEIPAIPDDFDRNVHRRLNNTLLLAHVVDLGLRGLPVALLHFAGALLGLVVLTLSGRYPADPQQGSTEKS